MVQQRLLDIAIAEFAAKGLEGASTRGIAAAAGTAMSSITYHYGGKEGLYLAAADHIASQIRVHMSAPSGDEDIAPDTTPEQARARIDVTIGRFAEMIAGQKNAAWSLFIVREQMAPTEAFGRIYDALMGRMLEKLVTLVRIATGIRDVRTAQIAVITLIGQVVVLRASRATILTLLDIPDIDAAAADALRRRIAANTDAILDRLIAERQELS